MELISDSKNDGFARLNREKTQTWIRRSEGYLQSLFVLLMLALVISYFYYRARTGLFQYTVFASLFLFLATDGIMLFLHLFREPIRHETPTSFDPSKLTIVIACYNGEQVIGETISQAILKVPPEQIIVVSDKSSDRTAEIARSFGVRVFENKRNVNKALSISSVMQEVKTPYTLVLDDDTHIGQTLIPTSLLDQGAAAVAFNVLPMETGTVVNKFQRFEYRKSMAIGKALRAPLGAVSNVSGAIGLYRTEDLQEQVTYHSGQFGGEDQQRTMLVRLLNGRQNIVYTDSTVITKAPDTVRSLFRQRAYRWGSSTHENFLLGWRIICNPDVPYLVKAERAYVLFILLTDPLRIMKLPVFFLHPQFLLFMFISYAIYDTLAWIKTDKKDPYWVVLLSPIYNFLRHTARFIAHFYWFKMKYEYVIKKKLYELAPDRDLLAEYAFVTTLLWSIWMANIYFFLPAEIDTISELLKKKHQQFDQIALQFFKAVGPANSATASK